MCPPLFSIGFTLFDTVVSPEGLSIRNPGGGAYFSSLAATLVTKESVGLVSRVGEDFDTDSLVQRLDKKGIKIVEKSLSTHATLTYLDAHDLSRREIKLELNVSADLNPEDIPPGWAQKADRIHLCAMPPQMQSRFIDSLLLSREVSTKGHIKGLSIDSESSLLKDEKSRSCVARNFLHAEVAFVNRVEAEIVVDILPKIPLLFVKRDKDGAEMLRYGKSVARCDAPKVIVKNATGAGDVFAGTCIALLLEGKEPEQALTCAVMQASRLITYPSFETFLATN